MLRRSSRLKIVGAEVEAAASGVMVGSGSGGDEVILAVAAGTAAMEAHLNALVPDEARFLGRPEHTHPSRSYRVPPFNQLRTIWRS